MKLANHLLRVPSSHVLLIGRSALDAEGMEEKNARYNELTKMPGKIEYINTDISNTQVLETAIESHLAKWQVPLGGIFHLAGSYHEKPLEEETAASLYPILHPKISGTVALSKILKQYPDAFLANFSSVLSLFVLGGSKVGAYAAANQFLDTYTAQLVSEGYRAFCFNWAGWLQTGMNQGPSKGSAFKTRGLFEFNVEQGLTNLRIGLGQDPGQLLIGLDPDNEDIQRHLSATQALSTIHTFYEAEGHRTPSQFNLSDAFGTEVTGEMQAVPTIPRRVNGDIDFPALHLMVRQGNSKTIAPKTETEQKLSDIWQRVLRLDSISTDWDFFEVGGQSLIATSLIAAVREEFSVEWTLSDIFSSPTIETQATAIEKAIGHGKTETLSIPVAPRNSALPLSSAQQRLWFLAQVEPESVSYNITASIRFRKNPDPDFVESCLNSIITRHESLRTVFIQENGVPKQKILDTLELKINIARPKSGQSLEDLIIEEGCHTFDLSEGPLIRATLVPEGEEEARLLLNLHHIISDGWSMRVFFKEFSRLYSGESTGSLPTLDIQYADYALWQQSNVKESLYVEQGEYWAKQLKGGLSGFTLPTDYPPPKIQTYNGARVTQHIPSSLSANAREFASNRGVTLFVMMLTLFKTLMARYTQREDIILGTVIANRDYVQIQNLIGFFVNPLVIRSTINPNLGFSSLLTQVSQVTLDAYANHDLPFERLVDQLQPVRDISRSPLFQIVFDLRDQYVIHSDVEDLRFGIMEPDLGSSQYDLHVALEEDSSELRLIWEYNTDLYSEGTIERLSENYQQLLSSVLAQPEVPVSELPLLTSEETALLDSWNESAAPFPDTMCMHQLFERYVTSQPDTDAVLFGDQRLSYAELNRRANQLAHYLREQGAGPDTIIAICLDRSIEMVVSVLAILKSGSAYLALDPTYPADRLAFMMEDSGVSLLLSSRSLAERLPAHQATVIEVDKNPMSGQPDSNPEVPVTPSNLAYVIYTSGSTGKPKGVLVEHHGWCNAAQFQLDAFDLFPGFRVLQFASLSFDASAMEFAMAWGCGGTLCLGTPEELLPGPNLAKMIQKNNVGSMLLPPTALGVMPDIDMPALKVITVGGDACPKEIVQQWCKPGRRFFNLYGPTETTILASYAECSADLTSPPPIGKPIPNMQLYVVNPQMQRLPIGMPGELCIGGEGVTRGYLNRPELTAERFIPDPFSATPGARMYRSGDLVRHLPDGNLEFLGRIDHQVKIRGYRIELGEIEALLRQFTGVAEAVVVAHKAQDGDQQLVAYVSPADQAELDHTVLREHLRKTLPVYMVPSQIRILDEMPLSSNGKVNRKALPSPESSAPQRAAVTSTPQSEMEQLVSSVWQKVLQLEAIDIDQNFFDLGGHSMKMAQVQTALSQKLNQKVPLADLFQYPTISTLAAHLGNGSQKQTISKDVSRKHREGQRIIRDRMAQLAVINKAPRNRT